jgi:Ca2+-binding EF-hand superfamily protein
MVRDSLWHTGSPFSQESKGGGVSEVTLKECFDLQDRDGDKKILVADLPTALRSAGKRLTDDAMKQLQASPVSQALRAALIAPLSA